MSGTWQPASQANASDCDAYALEMALAAGNKADCLPDSTDVLVVGGGMAGIAAAVSAAAAGARCVLLEREQVLGGNVTQAYVHSFCGLFNPPAGSALEYANPGFAPWFAEGLRRSGGALAPEVHGRVGVMPVYPSRVAAYANQVTGAFSTLQVELNATLTRLERDYAGGTQRARAVYRRGDAERQIDAAIVIDASGDATAAALIGAATETPTAEDLQHATLIFSVRGANESDLSGYSRLRLSAEVVRGSRSGKLPEICDSVLVRPGSEKGEAYISLNLPKPDDCAFNPLNAEFVQQYRDFACGLATELINFLRSHVPGWQNCCLLEWPGRVGIRESRSVEGRYRMSETDVLSGRRFPDAVARSSWPVELWNARGGATFRYPDSPCEIPLSALVSTTHTRLGMAGRCMSASHVALGALRVLGTAMATGEAIGLAAAIAADRGTALFEVASREVEGLRTALIDRDFHQP